MLFVLGKELGMRASEMINARCGWIEYSRFGDEETVVIDIVGKGDKQRRLPLSSEQVTRFLVISPPESALRFLNLLGKMCL